jgi:hypothetical protein
MMELEPPFRPATPADAAALAELGNFAGEGLPLYVWERLKAPGETAWEHGRRRAERETGAFPIAMPWWRRWAANAPPVSSAIHAPTRRSRSTMRPRCPCSYRCRSWKIWLAAPGT